MRYRLFALAAILLTGTAAAGEPVENVRFENGLWFDGRTFEPRTMHVANGRLTASPPATIARTVDLGGGHVIPPLCEAHNHNLGGDDDDQAVIRRYLADGIYYVGILSNLPYYSGQRLYFYNRPDSVDVIFANGGLTAPGGHPVTLRETLLGYGAYPHFTAETLADHAYFEIADAGDFDEKWPIILSYRPDVIKLFLLHSEQFETRRDDPEYRGRRGLDPALLPAMVARIHAHRLRAVVHVASGHDFGVAVRAGADVIAHLPGYADGSAIGRADAALAAERGVIVMTTAGLLAQREERDPEAYRGVREGQIANLQLLGEAGVRLAVGSDQYDETSRIEADYLRELGVFEPAELLTMWTENCVEALFPGRAIGTLAEGSEASLLVLEGNPLTDWGALGRIVLRVKDGEILSLPTATPALD